MAARGLILVRHALPAQIRGVAPMLWQLDESAREDCVLIAHALPVNLAPVVYSSDEPKAVGTADVIALRRGLRAKPIGVSVKWTEDRNGSRTIAPPSPVTSMVQTPRRSNHTPR